MKDFRKDFPLLERKHRGNRLAYFDNAATSPKPVSVITAVQEYYTQYSSNIHRGPNFLEGTATEKYEETRTIVSRFINCHPQEVIFTPGATAAFNLLARSWGETNLQEGDVVALSAAEHHANLVPWLQLKEKIGIKIVYIDIDEQGSLDRASWQAILADPKLKLLSVTQASNVLGQLYDLGPIISQAKERDIVTMVDACQSAAHARIDVTALGCDFLIFSGHKVMGPTGVGVLYIRDGILAGLPPFMGGGGMITEVKEQSFVPAAGNQRFEAGTPAIESVIGLGAALGYLNSIGWPYINRQEQQLAGYFLDKLAAFPFASLLGGQAGRLPLFSLALEDLHPHDAADLLGEEAIITRAGHHCAQPLHDRFGVPASLRASLAFYNTEEEIDRFFVALARIRESFLA